MTSEPLSFSYVWTFYKINYLHQKWNLEPGHTSLGPLTVTTTSSYKLFSYEFSRTELNTFQKRWKRKKVSILVIINEPPIFGPVKPHLISLGVTRNILLTIWWFLHPKTSSPYRMIALRLSQKISSFYSHILQKGKLKDQNVVHTACNRRASITESSPSALYILRHISSFFFLRWVFSTGLCTELECKFDFVAVNIQYSLFFPPKALQSPL